MGHKARIKPWKSFSKSSTQSWHLEFSKPGFTDSKSTKVYFPWTFFRYAICIFLCKSLCKKPKCLINPLSNGDILASGMLVPWIRRHSNLAYMGGILSLSSDTTFHSQSLCFDFTLLTLRGQLNFQLYPKTWTPASISDNGTCRVVWIALWFKICPCIMGFGS